MIGAEVSRSGDQIPIPGAEVLGDNAEAELIGLMSGHNKLHKALKDLEERGKIERGGSHPDDPAIIEQRRIELTASMDRVNRMIRKLKSQSPSRFGKAKPITDISQDYAF